MNKKVKKLIIGVLAITAMISIIPVKSVSAATSDFSIVNPTNCESIYRVADKRYINDDYNKSKLAFNADVLNQSWFYLIFGSVNTKKTAYQVTYGAYAGGLDESAKAFRYFLCGGQDGLEAGNCYIKIYDKSWDYSPYRDGIDAEIKSEQESLKEKYKGYKNLNNYNLDGLGVDSTSKLYLIDMDKLFATNKNACKYYIENIKYLSQFITNNKGSIPNNGNQIQIESSNDGITVLKSEEKNTDVQVNWGTDDWYYAIGGSQGDILSKVSAKNYGQSSMYYEVELNYCLQDMYKWPGYRKPGEEKITYRSWDFPGGIQMSEEELNKLHSVGMSQDYRMFGSYKDTIRVYPNGQITCKDKNSNLYVSIDNKNF